MGRGLLGADALLLLSLGGHFLFGHLLLRHFRSLHTSFGVWKLFFTDHWHNYLLTFGVTTLPYQPSMQRSFSL